MVIIWSTEPQDRVIDVDIEDDVAWRDLGEFRLGANDARGHGSSASVRMASLEEKTCNYGEPRRLIELETQA